MYMHTQHIYCKQTKIALFLDFIIIRTIEVITDSSKYIMSSFI